MKHRDNIPSPCGNHTDITIVRNEYGKNNRIIKIKNVIYNNLPASRYIILSNRLITHSPSSRNASVCLQGGIRFCVYTMMSVVNQHLHSAIEYIVSFFTLNPSYRIILFTFFQTNPSSLEVVVVVAVQELCRRIYQKNRHHGRTKSIVPQE